MKMGKTFLDNNEVYSLASVNCEENLKIKSGYISFNPPSQDGRCECCGKHINELEPFEKDCSFGGAYLFKSFRPVTLIPECQEYYGPDSSLECRDCIDLSDAEYFQKRWPEIANSPDSWRDDDITNYQSFLDAFDNYQEGERI